MADGLTDAGDPILGLKTTATDIYAFATLAYQCYTGFPPWADSPDYQVVDRIVAGQVPPRNPADARVPRISDWLWALCLRCWSLSPQARPDTRFVLEWLTKQTEEASSGVFVNKTFLTSIAYKGKQTPLMVFTSKAKGKGGTATIFEGTLFTSPEETVAVKVFTPSISLGFAASERGQVPFAAAASRLTAEDPFALVEREIMRWSELDHPHILPLYDFCEISLAQISLVSPYMTNGNMREFLARNPTADRFALLRQAADGLVYLHNEVKIVHGNLKCVNVLISPKKTALLADVGLSTLLEKTDDPTATWIRRLSTAAWAAPELFTDEAFFGSLPVPGAEGPVGRLRGKTTATDCYAFAMLIYETVTGQAPWGSAKYFQIRKAVVENRERPPRQDVFTDGVWNLCTHCWQHDPSARLSAEGIRAALAAL
ncbi:kinase-like protein [Auricularia subglabra TFB-10046 SS5]|nr:kinase-like protein [Auricularia subglabra TFB-10046 SS5]